MEVQVVQYNHATETSGFASKEDIINDHHLYNQSRYKKCQAVKKVMGISKIYKVFYRSPVPDVVVFADEQVLLEKRWWAFSWVVINEEDHKLVMEYMYISLLEIQSTKSAVLLEKLVKILKKWEINPQKTRFCFLDGTNSMLRGIAGLQKRFYQTSPYSIRVLATVKNSVVNTVFPIWQIVKLPNLFPKYLIECQNVKIIKLKAM